LRHVIVTYKLKPECVAEHLSLLGPVFDELAQIRPSGLRYAANRAPDGVSFTHIAAFEGPENPLTSLETFQSFVRDVRRRCEEPPRSSDVEVVGDYGLFS